MIARYGEDRFARRIAAAIVAARRLAPITRTSQLADLVAQAVPRREPGQHPATRTFQALRIHVNRELEEISAALPQALARLRSGGRMVMISFHSLEDRLVKRFLRTHSTPPPLPPGVGVRESERAEPPLKWVLRRVVPTAQEITRNPRARSAVLRAGEKR